MAIEAVVERFYDRVFSDEQLQPYFEDIDTDRLYRHQVAFLSAAKGGPDSYDGRDMYEAHRSLGVTDEDFDAVASHLEATLREFEVDPEIRTVVLEQINNYRGDIVTA